MPNTAFATALQATVMDSSSNPVSGVTVKFTAPATGPRPLLIRHGNRHHQRQWHRDGARPHRQRAIRFLRG